MSNERETKGILTQADAFEAINSIVGGLAYSSVVQGVEHLKARAEENSSARRALDRIRESVAGPSVLRLDDEVAEDVSKMVLQRSAHLGQIDRLRAAERDLRTSLAEARTKEASDKEAIGRLVVQDFALRDIRRLFDDYNKLDNQGLYDRIAGLIKAKADLEASLSDAKGRISQLALDRDTLGKQLEEARSDHERWMRSTAGHGHNTMTHADVSRLLRFRHDIVSALGAVPLDQHDDPRMQETQMQEAIRIVRQEREILDKICDTDMLNCSASNVVDVLQHRLKPPIDLQRYIDQAVAELPPRLQTKALPTAIMMLTEERDAYKHRLDQIASLTKEPA